MVDGPFPRETVRMVTPGWFYESLMHVDPLDLSRKEYGSIEGEVLATTTHYGHPAIRVRERLTGAEVNCILSDDLAASLGPQHSWSEVWTNRRVLISGLLSYKSDGRVGQVNAEFIESIEVPRLKYKDIADPHLTGGLSTVEFLTIGSAVCGNLGSRQ